jgi:hypothetical protein
MPITVEWANAEKTVVHWTITGDFTGQDVVDAMRIYASLVDSVDHPFVMLVDTIAISGSALSALSSFPQVSRSLPKRRAEAIIVVGNSQTIPTATNIFSRVYGGKFLYFNSMDEAREHLTDAFGIQLD